MPGPERTEDGLAADLRLVWAGHAQALARFYRGVFVSLHADDLWALAKPAACTLERWLIRNVTPSGPPFVPLLEAARVADRALHEQARRVASLVEAADHDEARTLLRGGGAFTEASHRLNRALAALTKELGEPD